jgi:integrase
MYIKKVGDKWRVFVEKNGQRPSKVCDTRAEAQRWGHEKELELEALKGSKGKTFAAAKTYYLKTVSPTKVNAVEWETRRLAAMEEFFGSKTPLVKIDSARIGQWRDWRLQGDEDHKPVSGETVLREANLLRNMFMLAKDEWKWISHEPFKGVRLPDGSDDRELIWRWREIRRIYRHLQSGGPKQQQVGWAFMTAIRTAMRLNEALAATLAGNIALLPRQKTSKAVVRAPVKVPLTRHGLRWMRRKPEITVGANEASTLFSEATLAIGLRKRGEEGLTFHDTRATACTFLARKVDVLTLSRISRHRDINILMRKYYRETAEQIAARL